MKLHLVDLIYFISVRKKKKYWFQSNLQIVNEKTFLFSYIHKNNQIGLFGKFIFNINSFLIKPAGLTHPTNKILAMGFHTFKLVELMFITRQESKYKINTNLKHQKKKEEINGYLE